MHIEDSLLEKFLLDAKKAGKEKVDEETGQIDMVLVKIADFYEEEVQVTTESLAAIIEPVMIILLGAGVGLISASVMDSIGKLSKNIGN